MPINRWVDGVYYDHKGDPVAQKSRQEHMLTVNNRKKTGMLARREALRRILADYRVYSKEQARVNLADKGFDVTLNTINRDFEAIGAVKVEPEGGGRRYYEATSAPILPGDEALDSTTAIIELRRTMRDRGWDVVQRGADVFIATSPGDGLSVALALDAVDWPEVVALIDGTSAVLVCCRDSEKAARVAALLREMQ